MIDATKSKKWGEEKRGANLNKWVQMANYTRKRHTERRISETGLRTCPGIDKY